MPVAFIQGQFMNVRLRCPCSEHCAQMGTALRLASHITGTPDAADIDRDSIEGFKHMILFGIKDY